MGWLTTKVRIFLEIIKYYNRLIKMDHSRLTYKVFEYDLQNISNENWSGDMETILNQIGMTETILTGTEIDLDSAEEKLSVVSDLDWQDSIYKPKLRTYTKYKDHIGTAEYLVINLTKLQRSLLAKLRSSTLQLAIEKREIYYRRIVKTSVYFFVMKGKLKMKSILLCGVQDIRLIGITFSHIFAEMFQRNL